MVIKRRRRAAIGFVSFDNRCPKCKAYIGWKLLARMFDGIEFDEDGVEPKIVKCKFCKAALRIELLADFGIREISNAEFESIQPKDSQS